MMSVDDDMPALTAMTVAPLDELSSHNDPTADSRTQSEHHQAVCAFAGTHPVFPVGRRITVVLEDNRLLEPVDSLLDHVVDGFRSGDAERIGECECVGVSAIGHQPST